MPPKDNPDKREAKERTYADAIIDEGESEGYEHNFRVV